LRGKREIDEVVRLLQEMSLGESVLGMQEAMEMLTGMARTSVSEFLGEDGLVDVQKVRERGRWLDEVVVDESERIGKEGEVLGVKRRVKVKVGRKEAIAMIGKFRGWQLVGAKEFLKREAAVQREASVHGVEVVTGEEGKKGFGGAGGFRLSMNFGGDGDGDGEVEVRGKIDMPAPVMLPGRRTEGGVLEIDVKNDAAAVPVRSGGFGGTDDGPVPVIGADGKVDQTVQVKP
jgi:hypothetical protein